MQVALPEEIERKYVGVVTLRAHLPTEQRVFVFRALDPRAHPRSPDHGVRARAEDLALSLLERGELGDRVLLALFLSRLREVVKGQPVLLSVRLLQLDHTFDEVLLRGLHDRRV